MGQALRLLGKARENARVAFGQARETFKDSWGRIRGNLDYISKVLADPWRNPDTAVGELPNGAGSVLGIFRRRLKSGSVEAERYVHMGPNHVYAFVTRKDGSIEHLGLSKNLLTNIGCMVLIGSIGADKPAGNTVASDISTGIGGTSVTGTGSVWTASALGTPTLGVAGWRVYMNAHTTTLPTVYGNVISNTTNVLTIDQWWKADDTLGATPTSGDAFIVGYGGIISARFMALSTNGGAAAYTDTTLTSEVNASNVSRTKATFARGSNPASGSGSFTQQVVWSPNGTISAIHKMGLFGDSTAASAGPMIFETVLNADATVANGDTLTVTDSITLSG
jgi:hypothetical protein